MVYKKDSFKFSDYKVTANGFLDISGVVTRNGIFKYIEGNELRPADEVFKIDSLSTMFAIPVTWEHPPDLLNDSTVQMYQKGFVASKPIIEQVNDNLSVVKLDNIIIQDKALIHEIVENGLREFSLGYTCDLEESKGRFDGEDYEKIQKNIIYNHLAVVKDARCGTICSITKREDSLMADSEYKADCACQKHTKQDESMKAKMEEPKMEEKKDEIEEPAWTKKMFEQHGKMLELLEKLAGGKKEEVEKEEDCMDEDQETEEEEEEIMKKKDKRKDSVRETVSTFNFSPSETRQDSSFKTYNRQDFLDSLLNKRS